jgi:hypothetical protein
MAETITSKFVKAFNPSDETHVTWFSRMLDMAEKLNDPTAHVSFVADINTNPMKVVLDKRDALDWPHIHFVLCGVYSKAVLRGKAFIPTAPCK